MAHSHLAPVLARTAASLLSVALLGACAAPARQGIPARPMSVAAAASDTVPVPPDDAAPELFAAVQQEEVFEDQKQFVDMVPRRDMATLERDYLAARDRAGFSLRRFVTEHFDPPTSHAATEVRQGLPLEAHIDALWPLLSRDSRHVPEHGSELALPRPYVVPGGRFREMYYWDSYFTMLGLHASGQPQRSRDMLDDFAHLLDRYGHIPNGTRSYYLSRSQPPFFSHMVTLEAERDGGAAVLVRYLPQLRAEHAYWMQGADALKPGSAERHVVRLRDGSVLNRYWDARDTPRPESWLRDRETAAKATGRPANAVYRELRAGAESGWDYSSRWFGDGRQLHTIRTTALVAVDLNSLLHHLESTIAAACRQAADAACAREFDLRASQRARAIERYLWNDGGFYADYDWQRNAVSSQLTAAAAYPLFAGIAPPQRAHATARQLQALLRPGGLVTTAVDTGEQWDAPNVWAPLQWVAVDGLRRYDEHALAARIAGGFLSQVRAVYAREHKLVEKYAADGGLGGGGGEYPLQDGFGWSNGVTRALLALYPTAPTQPPGAAR